MREILFRGKRIFHLIADDERSAMNDQKWVFGTYYVSRYEDLAGIIEEGHYIETSEIEYNNNAYILYSSGSYEVDPETVGQYTGLTDKNGVKIFEGDIVRLDNRSPKGSWKAVVEFGNPNGTYSWGYQLKRIGGDEDFNPDILLWIEMEEVGATCEVIGNIHDNPELLEAERNGENETHKNEAQ